MIETNDSEFDVWSDPSYDFKILEFRILGTTQLLRQLRVREFVKKVKKLNQALVVTYLLRFYVHQLFITQIFQIFLQ